MEKVLQYYSTGSDSYLPIFAGFYCKTVNFNEFMFFRCGILIVWRHGEEAKDFQIVLGNCEFQNTPTKNYNYYYIV